MNPTTRNPLVSVVTIFLNAEKFIAASIESVLTQSYADWELLLVDDGSTDQSTAIAQDYAARWPGRIRYLEHSGHRNEGMSRSRNLGIVHARGEFLAVLDADDIWLPEKLERQVSILERHPDVAMVYGSPIVWHSWTGRKEDVSRDSRRKLGIKPDSVYAPPVLFTRFVTRKADTPATCSSLLRISAVRSVDGWENSFRGMFEDQVFFCKIGLKFPVYVESGCWDYYRQHDDSSCHDAKNIGTYKSAPPSPSHKIYIDWLERHLLEQGITDRIVWDAFREARLPYDHPTLYRLKSVPGELARAGLKITKQWLPDSIWNAGRDFLKRLRRR